MIYTDSRYADGNIFTAYDSRNGSYAITVTREFPYETANFITYTWTSRDRMDLLANKFLGSPSFWWKIMDYNPELINGFNIPVGTTIRIPIV